MFLKYVAAVNHRQKFNDFRKCVHLSLVSGGPVHPDYLTAYLTTTMMDLSSFKEFVHIDIE